MKNVFKFLGIALVAGALMTACGEKYTVTVNVDNTMGTVTGAGEYAPDATCTLTATPNAGYQFVSWTNGTSTITDNPYTFNVTSNVTLTANFIAQGAKVDFGTTTWNATSCLVVDYSDYGLIQFGAFKNYESADAPYVEGYFRNSVGTATHSGQDDYYYFFYYENEDGYTTYNGNTYPTWQPETGARQEVTAIDLNAKTISATYTGACFNLDDYANRQVETIQDLVITVNNASFDWGESKSMKNMNLLK